MDKFFVAKALLLLILVVGLGLLVWASKAKPKKEIISQYSWFTFIKIMLIFYGDWRQLVLKEHLEVFSIYRFRVHCFVIINIILNVILSLHVLIFLSL